MVVYLYDSTPIMSFIIMGLGYFMSQQQKSMVVYLYDSTPIRSFIIMGLGY